MHARRALSLRTPALALAAIASLGAASRQYASQALPRVILTPNDLMEFIGLLRILRSAARFLPSQCGLNVSPHCGGVLRLESGVCFLQPKYWVPKWLRQPLTRIFSNFSTHALAKYGKKGSHPQSQAVARPPAWHWTLQSLLPLTPSELPEAQRLLDKRHWDTEWCVPSLKMVVRLLHIASPPPHVLGLLGKKYPHSAEAFQEAIARHYHQQGSPSVNAFPQCSLQGSLPGTSFGVPLRAFQQFEPSFASRRLRLPTPGTLLVEY